MLATLTIIFGALAALLHVYIFWMESVAWTTPRVRKTFGMTEQDASNTKDMALNQGFYNLFLAIAALVGVILLATGELTVSRTLIFVGAGSMLAAALVLLVTSPSKARAAITQGVFPLLAVASCALTLV